MSTNPNTVKSQHELTNEGGRKSDVLVATLEKCERLQKQLDIACNTLYLYAECPTPNLARTALDRIAELGGDYSHYLEQQLKDLELNKWKQY